MSLHPRAVLAAESGVVAVEVSPAPDIELDAPEGLGEATTVLVDKAVIVNLTRRGRRRTRVVVGIDYRDDHDAADALLEAAVATVAGALDTPAPQARCIERGESSVDFEIRYWTAPEIAAVDALTLSGNGNGP